MAAPVHGALSLAEGLSEIVRLRRSRELRIPLVLPWYPGRKHADVGTRLDGEKMHDRPSAPRRASRRASQWSKIRDPNFVKNSRSTAQNSRPLTP